MIPYAIAQGATEIPWALAQTLLFSCIAYFMIHFDFTAGGLPLVLSSSCRVPKVAYQRLISMPCFAHCPCKVEGCLLVLLIGVLQSHPMPTVEVDCFALADLWLCCAAKFFWFVLYQFLTLLLFTYYGRLFCNSPLFEYCSVASGCNFQYLLCGLQQALPPKVTTFLSVYNCSYIHAGMMAVAVSPSVQLAAVISSAFYSIWFLFTGKPLPLPKLPLFIQPCQ